MTDIKKSRSRAVLDFFGKHINGIYIAVSAVILFLVISLLTVSIVFNTIDVKSFDGNFTSFPQIGYSTATDESGNVTFTPLNNDPQLYLSPVEGEINTITIEFVKPLKKESIRVYFAVNNESLVEHNSTKAVLSSDKKTATVSLKSDEYTTLRIDIDEEFTPSKISLQHITFDSFKHEANLISIISLIVIFGLLIGFEKKFRYFTKIKELALCCVKSHIALFNEKKYVLLTVRALTCITLCVLAISYIFILMLAKMSTGIMVYIFVLSILFVSLFIAERILSSKADACAFFLAIALVFGIMMATLLPPMTSNSWDEEFHYAGCVKVRCLLFNDEKTYADRYQELREFPLTPDNYLNNTEQVLTLLMDYDSTEIDTTDSSVDLYKFIGFVPGAVMMFLGDAVNLNYLAMIALAKIANVLVYAFVIYFGIRRLKSGAMLFSSVALLPTAIFIASCFSYDYFVTALLMYSFAYFVSELQQPDKKFTLKDGIFMFGALVLGCGPKAIYFILGAPMLFMGKHKFESKKAHRYYLIACICAMLIVLFTFIVPFLFNVNGSSDNRGGETVSSGSQVDFILENPLKYTKILLKFLGEYVSFQFGATMAGSFAYLNSTPAIFGTLSILIMIFCAFTDKSEHDIYPYSTLTRVMGILTCFAQLALFATALYVSFTPVGLETINGCQWRYIIPALAPLLYFIGSGKIKNNIDKRVMCGFVYGGIALSLFASFYELYISRITF